MISYYTIDFAKIINGENRNQKSHLLQHVYHSRSGCITYRRRISQYIILIAHGQDEPKWWIDRSSSIPQNDKIWKNSD